MMSLPDFREKQVLFVEARYGIENRLQFQNDNILFRKNGKNSNRLSCHKVFTIFVIGDFSLTTALIKKCKQYGISLFLLSNNFQTYAEINSGLESNFLLRDKQYKFEEDLKIAKNIVKNKALNQLVLIGEKKSVPDCDARYRNIEEKILNAKDEKELLGIEGNLTREFFSEYFNTIGWIRRMPRTKYDINNLLLDTGYTFLFNFVDAILKLYGFDTYKGFYHKLFFQRKSLACDIMEPFRCIIERQLLKSHNLGRIRESDFYKDKGKYAIVNEQRQKYAGIFFEAIMDEKENIFKYVKDFYRFFVVENQKFPFYSIKSIKAKQC